MGRKILVSESEMLKMREEGMSNQDIARCLEVSYAFVRNKIGPQGFRSANREFSPPPHKNQEPVVAEKVVVSISADDFREAIPMQDVTILDGAFAKYVIDRISNTVKVEPKAKADAYSIDADAFDKVMDELYKIRQTIKGAQL